MMTKGFYGLWYDRPATQWTEALPVGNGRMGGMLYGGIQQDLISVNEETVWEGTAKDRTSPRARETLSEMRNAIFQGKYAEAERVSWNMLGTPKTLDSYQPLCAVHMDYCHTGIFTDYRRELNLNDGICRVSYHKKSLSGHPDGARFEREYFVSAADDLMAVRLCCSYSGGLDMDIRLSRFSDVQVQAEGAAITLRGRCNPQGAGVRFAAELSVRIIGEGEVQAQDGFLRLKGASELVLLLSAATDYDGGDPADKCHAVLRTAEGRSYGELRERHVADYRALYCRQSFSLMRDVTLVPTDALIRRERAGREDADTLYELWYNYLRYLIICSSRPGNQPSNLQGIWNDNMKAPWNSDYHPNINMQINYWTAEGYNLPECVEPLIDWLEKTAKAGETTAKAFYGADGWVLHHISDIFSCTTPMDGPWGIWPFGGAWLCRNVYEHYLYSRDSAFLRTRAYPLIRGAALFMLDFLIECPSGMAGEGYLVTCPSHSPENRFVTEHGEISWLTYGCAMDMEIIYDLFTIFLDAQAALGISDALTNRVKEARNRLAPIRVSRRTGGIMEWIDDYEESEPGHRHVSHLYALYPGTQISSRETELRTACVRTLDRRLSHDYDVQGWCCGWIGAMFARLKLGDRALAMLDMITDRCALNNLMVDAHGHPQVGDAQAVAATIQEMLAQSHEAELILLPALPKRWKSGQMNGLRVRGGHIVDMQWSEGRLDKAVLIAGCNTSLTVRLGGEPDAKVLKLQVKAGERYSLL